MQIIVANYGKSRKTTTQFLPILIGSLFCSTMLYDIPMGTPSLERTCMVTSTSLRAHLIARNLPCVENTPGVLFVTSSNVTRHMGHHVICCLHPPKVAST